MGNYEIGCQKVKGVCSLLNSWAGKMTTYSRRIGLVLILSGTVVPLICLPLADGYRKNAGILTNIQSMWLQITPDKKEPDFREVDSLDDYLNRGHLQEIQYGDTGTTLGFPDSMSKGEMEAAIKAERRLEKKTLPKYMSFYGWRVTYEGTRMPYRFVASGGLLLALTGLVVITVRSRQAGT